MEDDPLINLEMLCASMIISKKAELLESDFSMCFAYLLQMESCNPAKVIKSAIKIKAETFKKVQSQAKIHKRDSETELCDFEDLEDESKNIPEKKSKNIFAFLNPKKQTTTGSGDLS